MDKIVLVTGANGFVGQALIRLWAARQMTIVAMDRQKELIAGAAGSRATIVYRSADICDEELNLSTQSEYRFTDIVHCAALLSKQRTRSIDALAMKVNVEGTRRLVAFAVEQNARFIFPSTAMVYGDNPTPFRETMPKCPADFYALSKHLAEEIVYFYAASANLSYAIVRATILYGQGQTGEMFVPSAIRNLVENKPFPMTKGEQERDFIHIADFVSLLDAILFSAPGTVTVNAGSGTAISLFEAATIIKTKMESDAVIARGALPYRQNEMWRYAVDINRAREQFGWRPVVSF